MAKSKSRRTRTELRRKLSRMKDAYMVPASKLKNVYVERRKSGIKSLDFVLQGGYPKGCNIQLTGLPNAGKDLLLNLAIAAHQDEAGKDASVAIIYLEGQWDKNFARRCGVVVGYSKEELELLEDERGEEFTKEEISSLKKTIGHIDLFNASTQERVQDIIREVLESNLYRILIVNSVDNLIPGREAEGVDKTGASGAKEGQSGRGRGKLLSEHFRHQNVIMYDPDDVKDTTIFWVSQKRIVTKGMYSGAEHTGGSALGHNAALLLDVIRDTKGGTHMGPKNPRAEDHIQTSDDIMVVVRKGKYGIPDGGRTKFRVYKHDHYSDSGTLKHLAGDVDDSTGIRIALKTAGFLYRKGKTYLLQLPGMDAMEIGDGRVAVERFIASGELKDEIEEALYGACKKIREASLRGSVRREDDEG